MALVAMSLCAVGPALANGLHLFQRGFDRASWGWDALRTEPGVRKDCRRVAWMAERGGLGTPPERRDPGCD